MLCKCSGKYIDIYFILKITFCDNFSYVFFVVFPAFHHLFTPPKTPSFPTGPASIVGGFKGLSRINISSAVVFYPFLGYF